MNNIPLQVVAGNSQANHNEQSFATPLPAKEEPSVSSKADSSSELLAASHSSGTTTATTTTTTTTSIRTTTAPAYVGVVHTVPLAPQQKFFDAVASNNLHDITQLLVAHPHQIDIGLVDKATGKSPLRTALEARNDKVSQALVMHGAPVNALDDQGRTPVILAAAAGLKMTVNMLILRGATVDDIDKSGATALHHAVQGENDEIVRDLIRAKADVNGTDKLGCTPLHYAASAGKAETVQILIDAGAKADPKDKTRTTPLWNACKAGSVAMVKILLDKGAKAERYCGALKDSTPMLAACNGDNDVQALAIVKLLMDKKASANVADKKYGNVPLIAAARNGLFNTTAYLLNEGGAAPQCVNKAEETALYAAKGNVVKLLNDHGIKNGLRQKIRQ